MQTGAEWPLGNGLIQPNWRTESQNWLNCGLLSSEWNMRTYIKLHKLSNSILGGNKTGMVLSLCDTQKTMKNGKTWKLDVESCCWDHWCFLVICCELQRWNVACWTSGRFCDSHESTRIALPSSSNKKTIIFLCWSNIVSTLSFFWWTIWLNWICPKHCFEKTPAGFTARSWKAFDAGKEKKS